MPSSLFQQRRHTRRPPPICKSTWRLGRVQPAFSGPVTLTGWVSWIDLNISPPIDQAALIDVHLQPGGTEYYGSTVINEVTFTLEVINNPDPALYDLILTVTMGEWSDDDSWHDLVRPADPCKWETGELSHVHDPGIDENHAELTV